MALLTDDVSASASILHVIDFLSLPGAMRRASRVGECLSQCRSISATDPIVFLDLRYDLRIGQLVRGLNFNDTLSQRLGAAETLLELQLGLTRPEDQNGLRLPQLTDDLVVVPVKVLTVAVLVIFLAPAILRA